MSNALRRRGLAGVAVLYLLLLGASHLVRSRRPEPAPPADKLHLELAEQGVATGAERRLRVAYRSWGEPATNPARTVLLLHGSPGSSGDFLSLGPLLAGERRVIAPDLPGFGHSERRVADYSVAAHADYALELLERLAVDEVDVVGFSMGGGVALELAALAPGRVRS